MDVMVSLKASLEAWDQVDALVRRLLAAHAETLRQFEHHVCRPAAEKFGLAGVDLQPQRSALTRPGLTPAEGLPLLDSTGRAVEEQLRAFGERLAQNGCSAGDLRDVLETINKAIHSILETGHEHEEAMRSVAGRLRVASESDNVMLLRVLVRHQSAELTRLADESSRRSQKIADDLRAQVAELNAGLDTARQEARRDVLTGLLNRRALEELFREYEQRDAPRCLILLDIDRFKWVNDHYGYLAGDELLRKFGALIQASMEPSSVAARWGGDEFIILVDSSLPTGMKVAQQINRRLSGSFALGEGKAASVRLQASIGLSEWRAGESADQVIQRADRALKSHKHTGAPGELKLVQ